MLASMFRPLTGSRWLRSKDRKVLYEILCSGVQGGGFSYRGIAVSEWRAGRWGWSYYRDDHCPDWLKWCIPLTHPDLNPMVPV